MNRLILETGRLRLFEFSANNGSDVEFKLRLLNSTGPFITNRGVTTPEGSRRYLAERIEPVYAQHGYGMWKVELNDGMPIGMCGLVRRDGLDAPDLGYAFLPEFAGHGYAREAARGTLDFARNTLRIPRLLAIVDPDNIASIRLLQDLRFGFERMSRLPAIEHDVQLHSLELN